MLNDKWLVSGVNLDPIFQTQVPGWDVEEKRHFPFESFDARTRCPYPKPAGRDPISSIRSVSSRPWKRQPCSIVQLPDAACHRGGVYSSDGRPVAGFGNAGFVKKENARPGVAEPRVIAAQAPGRPLVILNTGTQNFYHFIVDVMAPTSSVLGFLQQGLADRIIFYGPKPAEGSFHEGFFRIFQRRCPVPIAFEEADFTLRNGFFLLSRLPDVRRCDETGAFLGKETEKPIPFYVSDSIGTFFSEMGADIPLPSGMPLH